MFIRSLSLRHELSSLVLISLVSALLPACKSTVSVWAPQQRFLTSEVEGKAGQGQVAMSYGSQAKLVLADELGRATPNTEDAAIAKSDALGIRGKVGLLRRVDVFYATDLGLGAKFQLHGPPHSRRRKARGTSVAISLAGNLAKYSESSTKTYDATGRTIDVDTESAVKTLDGAVMVGRRVDSSALFYLSTGYTKLTAEGSFDRDIEDEETEHWDLKKRGGSIQNLLAGYHLTAGGGFSMKLETGFARTQLDDAETQTRFVLGTHFALAW